MSRRTPRGLPTASGWLLLVGQPIGMLLAVVWRRRELRAGVAQTLTRTAGQLTAGVVLAFALAGARRRRDRRRRASACNGPARNPLWATVSGSRTLARS